MRLQTDESEGGRPRLLTIPEVMAELSCSKSFLYDLFHRGKIKRLVLAPKCVRVSSIELKRYLDSL